MAAIQTSRLVGPGGWQDRRAMDTGQAPEAHGKGPMENCIWMNKGLIGGPVVGFLRQNLRIVVGGLKGALLRMHGLLLLACQILLKFVLRW